MNQRVASSGYTADGTNWFLARTVTITGSTLRAVLSNNANGYVVADAVRIERVGAAAPVARGAVLSDRTSSGSEGTGIFIASLSSQSGQGGGQEQHAVVRKDLALAHRQEALFGHNLDLAPELALLEETLSLVREVSRHVRPTDSTSSLEELFSLKSDWLAVV